MVINIAICDDDRLYSSLILNILEEECKKKLLKVNFDIYESGEELLKEVKKNPFKYPIIFLDILMGGITGIETSKEIKALNDVCEIIFITSSKEFVFDSYNIGAFNYILKPVDKQMLKKQFDKVLDKFNKNAKGFVINKNGEIYYLDVKEIIYFELINRIIVVEYTGGQIEYYEKMSDIEKKLECFIRPHRGFLVNPRYIFKLSGNEMILKNGKVIPISRLKLQKVKAKFLDFVT